MSQYKPMTVFVIPCRSVYSDRQTLVIHDKTVTLMAKHVPLKLLFASSEATPLCKTGGLADVAGSLPPALAALTTGTNKNAALDVHLVLPAYPQAIAAAGHLRTVATLPHTGAVGEVRILEGQLPDSDVTLWLVDAPQYFARSGGPYADAQGNDWPDNAARFAIFSRAVTALALDQAGLDWCADIVHANDWQTALVPALLSRQAVRPASVFTIHNLAYQGVYPADTFFNLSLPREMWTMHGLEYHGNLCLIKGGLVYADALTTVSPTYAKEICTPEYGFGLDGLLRHRADHLHGIINGIDYTVWNPKTDSYLKAHYDRDDLGGKRDNKLALQTHLDLPVDANTPLLSFIGRLVWQKGVDVISAMLPALLQLPVQVVILGSGEKEHERSLRELARMYPDKLSVAIGYNEALAHQIEAGADMFIMPSRYEPCGLNQIYSLRYGTVPIVSDTGGLADTVIDAADSRRGTGFQFKPASAPHLLEAIQRALALYQQPKRWQSLVRRGMKQDFSWQHSARDYLDLYKRLVT
jgi:starch synthase